MNEQRKKIISTTQVQKMIRMTYDEGANAAYIYMKDPVERGESVKQEIASGESISLIIDLDKNGKILGIEFLMAKQFISDLPQGDESHPTPAKELP
jgi:uncharacterized protein YuzE